jgi:hypothetical protein
MWAAEMTIAVGRAMRHDCCPTGCDFVRNRAGLPLTLPKQKNVLRPRIIGSSNLLFVCFDRSTLKDQFNNN